MGEKMLNADTLIERFGGIRPMAAKTGIAVTTVQGWKKRGIIPENREFQILEAARVHGVDLSNLLSGQLEGGVPSGSPLSANDSVEPEEPCASESGPAPVEAANLAPALEKLREMLVEEREQVISAPAVSLESAQISSKNKPSRLLNGAWVALMILATAVLVGLLAMGPGVKRLMVQEQRLVALERELYQTRNQMGTLQSENAVLSGVVPEEVKKQIEDLSNRARLIEETMRDLGTQTRALTEGVMGESDGTIEHRLSKIEGDLSKSAQEDGRAQMINFLARLQTAQGAPEGRRQFDQMMIRLQATLNRPMTSLEMRQKLRDSLKTDGVLKQAFADLNESDLSRAVAVVALIGLRRKLEDGPVSFDWEISVLKPLLPEQGAQMTALAAHAKAGVLSLPALATAFEGASSSIVSASLTQKGVSLTDRFLARLHNAFRIEYRGAALTGTPTQRTVDRVRRKMKSGDVLGAIEEIQALDGKAAEVAAPWVRKAEASVQARAVLDTLIRGMSAELSLEPLMNGEGHGKTGALLPQEVMRGIVFQNLSVAMPRDGA